MYTFLINLSRVLSSNDYIRAENSFFRIVRKIQVGEDN